MLLVVVVLVLVVVELLVLLVDGVVVLVGVEVVALVVAASLAPVADGPEHAARSTAPTAAITACQRTMPR